MCCQHDWGKSPFYCTTAHKHRRPDSHAEAGLTRILLDWEVWICRDTQYNLNHSEKSVLSTSLHCLSHSLSHSLAGLFSTHRGLLTFLLSAPGKADWSNSTVFLWRGWKLNTFYIWYTVSLFSHYLAHQLGVIWIMWMFNSNWGKRCVYKTSEAWWINSSEL